MLNVSWHVSWGPHATLHCVNEHSTGWQARNPSTEGIPPLPTHLPLSDAPGAYGVPSAAVTIPVLATLPKRPEERRHRLYHRESTLLNWLLRGPLADPNSVLETLKLRVAHVERIDEMQRTAHVKKNVSRLARVHAPQHTHA